MANSNVQNDKAASGESSALIFTVSRVSSTPRLSRKMKRWNDYYI